MNWKTEWKTLVYIIAGFAVCFYLPVGTSRFDNAIIESFHLLKWYAREHVLFCLVPAFFIAGAISVFVSQASVMKYLGAKANKFLAYGVASISGTVLAVCSCTVLPLFGGIYIMGAGIGPASAFLYSGPAINVLAIVMSARILGMEMGIARAVGAVLFSVIIGILMHLAFRSEEKEKEEAQMMMPEPEVSRPLWQNMLYFASMIGILVFANWGKSDSSSGFFSYIHSFKWIITSIFSVSFGVILVAWFKMRVWKMMVSASAVIAAWLLAPGNPDIPFATGIVCLSLFTSTSEGELNEWFSASWEFTKQILPLLLAGVLVAGALLGRIGHEGLIPSEWISSSVGGNSFFANFFASVAGAFMYFATLTEIPILQGLIGSGMGKGPALALLLAGPALSLPSILVLRSIMGTKKTMVFVCLVVVMATITGSIFGLITG